MTVERFTGTGRTSVTFHAVPAFTAAGADHQVDDNGAGPGDVTVSGLIVPLGVTVPLNAWGDTVTFAPGAFDPLPSPASRVKLLADHDLHPFGYASQLTADDHAVHATFTVPAAELTDPRTATVVRQMGNGVRDALSIGAELREASAVEDRNTGARAWTVTTATLLEVSSVVVPRFADARHEPVNASHQTTREDPAMPDTTTTTIAPQLVTATAAPPAAGPDPRLTAHLAAAGAPAAGGPRWPSFAAFALDCAAGAVDLTVRAAVFAALADQTTADVPGLVPDAWVRDVVDVFAAVTPTLAAFRQVPLPDAGMSVTVPVVQQGPDVGKQPGEKQDISTRKVLVAGVPFPVETYAGGQDVSIQTLLRTDPAYLDLLMRLFVREMAIQMEIAATTALVAGATATSPFDPDAINASFIGASKLMLTTVGQFPTVTVLGVDMWELMGTAEGTDGRPLFPGLSPVNPVGSFTATDGTGQVRGLDYVVSPWIAADTAIVGVREAFVSMRSAMGVLSADVPGKLGRDTAVYEFAAMGVTDARGLVKMVTGP